MSSTGHRPGVTLIAVGGHMPRIHDSAFVAPGCRIIGDVTIGPEASIWYNCVLRADMNRIVIGARANVQDGSVLHCDHPMPGYPDGFPCIVGDDALIGHMAMIHGCTIMERGFVGLKATVMNGACVESDAMLAAGAMLTQGKTVPAGHLWAGSPARFVRHLSDEEIAGMRQGVAGYVRNARVHRAAIDGTGDVSAD